MTRQTILALEAGKYTPSLTLAFRLARAFGLPVEGVFQYVGAPADGAETDGPVRPGE